MATGELPQQQPTLQRAWPVQALPLALLGGLLAAIALIPAQFRTALDVLGFGVCHQILSRSLVIGGHPLPVCARDTGIYLGALVGFGLLAWLRPRAAGLPGTGMIPILALLFLTMVADGLNSTAQSLPGLSGLWETTNTLRIVTGTLAGVSIAFFLYPLFNSAFWRRSLLSREPALERPFELFGYGVALLVLVGLALSSDGDPGATWVYWLIALLSTTGLFLLLTLANTMIVSLALRREGLIGSWRAALLPLAVALVLALAELLLLSYGRGALQLALGGPFPAGMPLGPGLR